MPGPFVTTGERRSTPVVRITERTLAAAGSLARGVSPNELGGIIVGWWEGGRVAIVDDLLPVPDDRAGRAHYERRQWPAQRVLDDYLRTGTSPYSGYIGEWHSHPEPQPPSPIDRGALSAIVRQVYCPIALLVLALDRQGEVAVHGLVGRSRWPHRAVIEHTVVERMEP